MPKPVPIRATKNIFSTTGSPLTSHSQQPLVGKKLLISSDESCAIRQEYKNSTKHKNVNSPMIHRFQNSTPIREAYSSELGSALPTVNRSTQNRDFRRRQSLIPPTSAIKPVKSLRLPREEKPKQEPNLNEPVRDTKLESIACFYESQRIEAEGRIKILREQGYDGKEWKINQDDVIEQGIAKLTEGIHRLAQDCGVKSDDLQNHQPPPRLNNSSIIDPVEFPQALHSVATNMFLMAESYGKVHGRGKT